MVPEKFQSYEHVPGYKSGVVYGFDKTGVPLRASASKIFKEFFAGYN